MKDAEQTPEPLTREELEALNAEELPPREVMTVIVPGWTPPLPSEEPDIVVPDDAPDAG